MGTSVSTWLLQWTPIYIMVALGIMGIVRLAVRELPKIMEQINARVRSVADIEASQIERMDARLQRLEESEQRCQRELAELREERNADRSKIAEMEGFLMGQGKARQEASRIVAVERLEDKKNGDDK